MTMIMRGLIEKDCKQITKWIPTNVFRDAKILVTGANGLLGQYLIKALVTKHRDVGGRGVVVGVSLHKPSALLRPLVQSREIKFIKKDLSRPFRLADSFDFIFHAAGYGQPTKFLNDPFSMVAVNVIAAKELLENCRKNRGRLIFFSSADIYGDIPPEELPVKESYNGNCPLATPRAIYAEAKRLGETLCHSYARLYNLEPKIVRISHTYGPGARATDDRVLNEFIRKALTQKKINLLDEGRALKTFGYVADVVAMILYVGFAGKETTYNVGGRDIYTVRQLAEAIGDYCKVPVIVPRQKSTLAHIGREPQAVRLDLFRILKEMKGFQFTSFEKGIKNSIEWMGNGSKNERKN